MSADAVEQAVANMNTIVAADGGEVTLIDRGPEGAGPLRVAYELQDGGDCEACAITPEMLETFLGEALRRNGAEIQDVVIEPKRP